MSWTNLSSVKSGMKYIFVEIGINDCVSGNITDIKARYASLINQLKTDAMFYDVLKAKAHTLAHRAGLE